MPLTCLVMYTLFHTRKANCPESLIVVKGRAICRAGRPRGVGGQAGLELQMSGRHPEQAPRAGTQGRRRQALERSTAFGGTPR